MDIDFKKGDGLVPVIVQGAQTLEVLMLGYYMNEEAYNKTCASKQVTFFSRSKSRLWTKGEQSGHYLNLSLNSSKLLKIGMQTCRKIPTSITYEEKDSIKLPKRSGKRRSRNRDRSIERN